MNDEQPLEESCVDGRIRQLKAAQYRLTIAEHVNGSDSPQSRDAAKQLRRQEGLAKILGIGESAMREYKTEATQLALTSPRVQNALVNGDIAARDMGIARTTTFLR